MEMITPPPPDDDSGVVCEICHKKVFEHSFEEQQSCSAKMPTASRSSCRYCGGQIVSDKPTEYCSSECHDSDQEEIRRAKAGHF